jgi:hypothetical protein
MERYRTTLIMAVVLIVLVALAFFLTSKNASAPTGSPTPTTAKYIWQDTNSVKAIDVVSGTQKVGIAKDSASGEWSIAAPVSRPADPFQVGNEADALQNLQAQFELTGTTDLDQYGLTNPPLQVTVTFSDTGSSKRVLLVGSATTDGSGYYVKTPDNSSVFVLTNTTVEPLRSWLANPPVQQPTATPVPITPVTDTPTPTTTATTVPGAAGAEATSTPPAALSPTP